LLGLALDLLALYFLVQPEKLTVYWQLFALDCGRAVAEVRPKEVKS